MSGPPVTGGNCCDWDPLYGGLACVGPLFWVCTHGAPGSPGAVGQGLGRVEGLRCRGVLQGDAHPALHPQHCLHLPHSRLLRVKSLK